MLNFLRNKKHQKGFTLIELLIVIAIIGILSGIVVVAVRDAVNRAEDAERMSNVKQLSFILGKEVAIGNDEPLGVNCTSHNSDTSGCTLPASIGLEFPRLLDPEHDNTGIGICAHGVTGPCRFGISNELGNGAPQTDDYQICFYLEVGAGGLSSGLNSIGNGMFRAGCKH